MEEILQFNNWLLVTPSAVIQPIFHVGLFTLGVPALVNTILESCQEQICMLLSWRYSKLTVISYSKMHSKT